jgi:hypothetical protein
MSFARPTLSGSALRVHLAEDRPHTSIEDLPLLAHLLPELSRRRQTATTITGMCGR